MLGHVLAVRELMQQCESIALRPGTIWLAVGSGGTLAGWLLGSTLLEAPWRVEGVTVSRPADEVRERVAALALEAARVIDAAASVAQSDIVVHDGYIGAGYGIPSAAGNTAIELAARCQGVFFDPTYTGKAFAGLADRENAARAAARGPVVFIHTGGEPALFAAAPPNAALPGGKA